MRVFVYEMLAAGGSLPSLEGPVPVSLRREGLSMLRAVLEDFNALNDVQAVTLVTADLGSSIPPRCQIVITTPEHELTAFTRLAAKADFTLVIAPEIDGALLDRCRIVEASGGRLLGPSCPFVAVASDKLATSEGLRAAGVPAPHSRLLEPDQPLPLDFPYPAVRKLRIGAGSLGARLIAAGAENLVPRQCSKFGLSSPPCQAIAGQASSATRILDCDKTPGPLIADGRELLEPFIPGVAASVAVMAGSDRCWPLPACRQLLSEDGTFAYLGGSLPLKPLLNARAQRLAMKAASAIEGARGYVGVDLVLGADTSGQSDAVIEINPRLTTSYLGLRAAARSNLARAMLDVSLGRDPELRFTDRPVEFQADGTVRIGTSSSDAGIARWIQSRSTSAEPT